eukprot:4417288-Prymnesium_polylepis.1
MDGCRVECTASTVACLADSTPHAVQTQVGVLQESGHVRPRCVANLPVLPDHGVCGRCRHAAAAAVRLRHVLPVRCHRSPASRPTISLSCTRRGSSRSFCATKSSLST